jgi:cell division transport system permease protein
MSLRKYSDIPLNADPSGRFVPWIVALMVYLATISLTVAFVVSSLINRWDTGFTARLSVEIPAYNAFDPDGEWEMTKVKGQVAQILLRTPGIGSVRTLSKGEVLSTLEPWLGENSNLEDLPLPTLLEVEVKDRDIVDIVLLKQNLQEIMSGIIVEDHMGWQRGILDLAHSAQVIGFLIVAMIILAAVSTIAFTSQTSLIIHRNVIEILYLVGATDDYIARQFQYHALRVGIRGGAVGFFMTGTTFIVLKFFARDLDTTLLNEVVSNMALWSVALLVPLFVTIFMMMAARLSVRLALKYVL